MFRFLIGWAILCGTLGPAAAQPRPAPAAPPKQPSAPMVFVAATGNYTDVKLPKLEQTVGYAVDLAKGFVDLHCQVRFATDQQSVAAVQKGLGVKAAPQNAPGRGTTVAEFNDGAALTREIERWIKEVAAAQPAVAYIVFSGHGVERPVAAGGGRPDRTVPYFLCRDDSHEKGGVPLEAVREAAVEPPGIHLVIVYNACRTLVDPKQPNAKNPGAPAPPPAGIDPPTSPAGTGTGTLSIHRAERAKSGLLYPTVLYAVRSGEKAEAKEDLVSSLARGLKFDAGVRAFLKFNRVFPGNPNELTLLHWFYYGLSDQLITRRLLLSHQIEEGSVPLDAVVARLQGNRTEPALVANWPIDLLDAYKPTGGNLTTSFNPQTGWTIVRPLEKIESPWAVGNFVAMEEGYDIADKVLVVDLVAYPGPKVTAGHLPFEIHAKSQGADPMDFRYLASDQKRYGLVYNQLYRVTIPLQTLPGAGGQPRRMNYLAFAELRSAPKKPLPPGDVWPPGSALVVAGLKLVSRDSVPPLNGIVIEDVPVNLVRVCDYLDTTPVAPFGALQVNIDRLNPNPFPVRLQPTEPGVRSRVGGGFTTLVGVPRVYVPRGNVLEVEAANDDKQAAEFTLELLAPEAGGRKRTAFTERNAIPVPAGKAVKTTVRLVETGYADYFAITTGSPGLRLKSATIKPGPPAK